MNVFSGDPCREVLRGKIYWIEFTLCGGGSNTSTLNLNLDQVIRGDEMGIQCLQVLTEPTCPWRIKI
jgi:hypothetical protein